MDCVEGCAQWYGGVVGLPRRVRNTPALGDPCRHHHSHHHSHHAHHHDQVCNYPLHSPQGMPNSVHSHHTHTPPACCRCLGSCLGGYWMSQPRSYVRPTTVPSNDKRKPRFLHDESGLRRPPQHATTTRARSVLPPQPGLVFYEQQQQVVDGSGRGTYMLVVLADMWSGRWTLGCMHLLWAVDPSEPSQVACSSLRRRSSLTVAPSGWGMAQMTSTAAVTSYSVFCIPYSGNNESAGACRVVVNRTAGPWPMTRATRATRHAHGRRRISPAR